MLKRKHSNMSCSLQNFFLEKITLYFVYFGIFFAANAFLCPYIIEFSCILRVKGLSEATFSLKRMPIHQILENYESLNYKYFKLLNSFSWNITLYRLKIIILNVKLKEVWVHIRRVFKLFSHINVVFSLSLCVNREEVKPSNNHSKMIRWSVEQKYPRMNMIFPQGNSDVSLGCIPLS